ncbi:MAG: hypothetical protein M3Q49_00050 [Actinomycetota bacterium]|nr:hypothetical protein [Actinomycetota bacterium]
MGRDGHGPPPGLSEEERRRWWQWRKFIWMEGDIVITSPGDRKKPREGTNGDRSERTT